MTLTPLAIFALVSWPFVALWLYSTRPVGQATLWTILGAFMLLPPQVYIKFEMIPQLDKSSIPSLAALLGCMLFFRSRIRFSYGFGLAEVLLVTILVSPLVTSLLNNDQIVIGGTVLPATGLYDAGSASIAQFIV